VSARTKYKFISIKLTKDRLTFTTQTISGVHYKFDGRILKLKAEQGDYYYLELEGTLTKLSNGEKVGEVTSQFKYEEFGD
jgi:ribosomal 30S subunit maturation factor RimM